MNDRVSAGGYGGSPGLSPGGSHIGVVIAVIFGVLVGVMGWLLIGRAGVTMVTTLLGMVVVGSILSYIAWHNFAFLVTLWLFALSGFRTYAMLPMPFLPDLSVDRVLSVWVVIMFAVRLLVRIERVRGPFVLDVLLLAHAAYILANTMYIGSQAHTHEWSLSSVTPLVGYLMGKNIIYRERELRYLFKFIFVLMIYYAIQSIGQKFNLTFLVWPKTTLDLSVGLHHVGRSRGPFLHPPLFGQIMAMLLPIQIYVYFRVKGRLQKGSVLAVLLMTAMGMLYTYTRAPWVAAIVGLLVLAFLRPRYRQLLLGTGVVVAMAAFLGIVQVVESDSAFLQERFTNLWTIKNRAAALSAAIRIWKDNPLFGVGFFNWGEVYGMYRRGEEILFLGYVERYAGAGIQIHDIYFGRLAEEGIVSIALLGSALGIVWFRIRRLWEQVSEQDVLNRDGLAAIVASLVVYLVGGLAIDFRYFDMVNAIPYLFMGILYGYEVPKHPPPPPPYRLWKPPYFVRREADGAS
jgi:hypothetical protein